MLYDRYARSFHQLAKPCGHLFHRRTVVVCLHRRARRGTPRLLCRRPLGSSAFGEIQRRQAVTVKRIEFGAVLGQHLDDVDHSCPGGIVQQS